MIIKHHKILYDMTVSELDKLFSGKSKEYGLHSQTLQAITKEYATRVRQFGKTLRWRGRKATGWIPFKSVGIKLKNGKIKPIRWKRQTLWRVLIC
jgi:putative transposase